ncbi:MAG: hypothetical protein AAGJ28_20330 [Pseudomonadota bacterium]
MTLSVQSLNEHLSPLRERTIAGLLDAQVRALDAGADIEPEPVRRNHLGEVRRDGPLDLPLRGDLMVTLDGRTLIQQVESELPSSDFTALNAVTGAEFSAIVRPFQWDAARLIALSEAANPNWKPLRHCFLEWFQPRQTVLTPELAGVVHELKGPVLASDGWRIDIDLGSAPVEVVPAMIAAVAMSGVSKLEITAVD